MTNINDNIDDHTTFCQFYRSIDGWSDSICVVNFNTLCDHDIGVDHESNSGQNEDWDHELDVHAVAEVLQFSENMYGKNCFA